jgi:hypothetical protein
VLTPTAPAWGGAIAGAPPKRSKYTEAQRESSFPKGAVPYQVAKAANAGKSRHDVYRPAAAAAARCRRAAHDPCHVVAPSKWPGWFAVCHVSGSACSNLNASDTYKSIFLSSASKARLNADGTHISANVRSSSADPL